MSHSVKGVRPGEGMVVADSGSVVKKQRKSGKRDWATKPNGPHMHNLPKHPLFLAKFYLLSVPSFPKQPYQLGPNVQTREPVGGISTQTAIVGDAETRLYVGNTQLRVGIKERTNSSKRRGTVLLTNPKDHLLLRQN